MTMSASSARSAGRAPAAASTPAILSESFSFIWQPNVRRKKLLS